jgi:hypothetical protein
LPTYIRGFATAVPTSYVVAMGNTVSAQTVHVLQNLTGPHPIPLSDEFWKALLTFTTPLSRFDPAEVERELRPYTASLGLFYALPGSSPWYQTCPVLKQNNAALCLICTAHRRPP